MIWRALAFGAISACILASSVVPSRAQSGFYGPAAIVPGVLIGHVHLGGDVGEQTRTFGAPTFSSSAMGHSINTWNAAAGGNAIGITSAMVGGGPKYAVREIRVTSAYFKTRAGIGVGSSLKAVQRAFPEARPVSHRQKAIYLGARAVLDDRARGIAFEFLVEDGSLAANARCTAVTIHAPGKSVLDISPSIYTANAEGSLSVNLN